MFTIAKHFDFAASHRLVTLPPAHKCSRLHGHNYRVTLILAAKTLDKDGFVVDYGDLYAFKLRLDVELDHRHLNDVLPEHVPPTAEALAAYLYEVATVRCQIPCVVAVRVAESASTWAEYRP